MGDPWEPPRAVEPRGGREWSFEWEGHTVLVRNWTRRWRTGEELLVDGVLIDANESSVLGRTFAHLGGVVSLGGRRHTVEALLGQGQGRLRVCCHILVDGNLVGGDVGTKMALPVDDLEEIYRGGRARFLLTQGVVRMGLPWAIGCGLAMGLIRRPANPLVLVAAWGAGGVVFGLLMGLLLWRSVAIYRRSREEKLQGPPRYSG